MSSGVGRTPPRFVPTLTTVVDAPAAAAPAPAGAAPLPDHVLPAGSPPPPPPALRLSDEQAFRLEEELLHRVLQRVDLSLEARLTDTVSAAVQQQLDTMLPNLRDNIETVLRQLVVEALAHELSENLGPTPTNSPHSLG